MKNTSFCIALLLGLLPVDTPALLTPSSALRHLSPTSPTVRTGKDYAVFFAVRDYDEWPDLKNPVKDAEAIAADLKEHYKFQTEIIQNPTRNQILDKLSEYRNKKYDPDAQLLVFFSGHGYFDDNVKNGYIVPKNGKRTDPYSESYISHIDMRRRLTAIPCRHILYLADACYSGTMDDNLALKGERASTRSKIQQSEAQRQALIRDKLKNQSRYFLTSGGKERTPDGVDHSPFTNKLLEGLRTFGGRDGYFTFEELYQEFMAKIPAPTPVAGKFEGHEGGDFLFIYDSGITGKPGTADLAAAVAADRDGDDVPDAVDQCPDVFGMPGAAGCPDADGDGVPDQSDKCKYAAGDKRFQGCPDSDDDGVPDNDDQCPEEKGLVSNNGCPQSGGKSLSKSLDPGSGKEFSAPAQPKKMSPANSKDYVDPLAGSMVYAKGGTYPMGSSESGDEKPIHNVTLSDFYISKYEVTQEQWRKVMGSDPPGMGKDGCVQCPVSRVDWNDIQNFLSRLNEQTGQHYRLPTEAEWEYAARGGTYIMGFKYAGSNEVKDVAWYDPNSKTPKQVGQKMPNGLGLYDMSGNVYEWCSDFWDDKYPALSLTDPKGPESGTAHVLRGGSSGTGSNECRVTFRRPVKPGAKYPDAGFRIVRD